MEEERPSDRVRPAGFGVGREQKRTNKVAKVEIG